MGKCGGSVPDHKTHTMIGQGGGYAQQSLALLNKKPFITMTLNNLICVARDPGLHRLTPTSQSDSVGKCGGSVPDHKTHTMIGQGGGYAQQSLALLNKKPFITMTLNNLICVARDPGLHRLTPTSQSDRSKTYFTLSTN